MNESQVAEVLTRLDEQGRGHWREFALIVASANIAGSCVLLGTAIVGEHPAAVTALGVALASATLLATALAYFSIEVGALTTFGRLRWDQIVISFVIAATEFGMAGWPVHVIRSADGQAELAAFLGLRHWLLIFAAFAFAAASANGRAAIVRNRHLGDGGVLQAYDRRQRRDRYQASGAGALAILLWVLGCVTSSLAGVAVGVAFVGAAMALGVRSQSLASRALESAVTSAARRSPPSTNHCPDEE